MQLQIQNIIGQTGVQVRMGALGAWYSSNPTTSCRNNLPSPAHDVQEKTIHRREEGRTLELETLNRSRDMQQRPKGIKSGGPESRF